MNWKHDFWKHSCKLFLYHEKVQQEMLCLYSSGKICNWLRIGYLNVGCIEVWSMFSSCLKVSRKFFNHLIIVTVTFCLPLRNKVEPQQNKYDEPTDLSNRTTEIYQKNATISTLVAFSLTSSSNFESHSS